MALTVPPTTQRDLEGWADYTAPIVLTPAAAADVSPGCGDPALAVIGFYAALMRNDDVTGYLLTPDDNVMVRKLETLRSWTFRRLEVRSVRLRGSRKATIRIAVEIDVDGKRDDGTDEIKLQRDGDDGPWRIERPPT
ncbi:hypothetical protein MB901379_04684 [Mycobacterium basiliense]|uniref:DUF4440 domain-containing protein n=1 Tax=Mycobacterium basiliense TaxID=2094119 RepID=A0A3S4BLW3_9MYCO|nr:hypothetical protein [Mycobacterium basiliense]VDM91070.1 hypothetical protein MB901379_04684 [Mycobacterium basiliense]